MYQYCVEARFVGVSSSRLTGNVGVELSVTASKDPKSRFTKKYDGTFYNDKFGFTVANVIEIQNQALLSMIKELTSDTELLDFLRRQNQAHAQGP